MSLDDISKAAQKERDKKNRPSVFKPEKEKVFHRVSAESWSIYSKIYPYHISFGFIMIGFLLATVCITWYFLSGDDWSFYGMITSIGILVLRFLVFYIIKIYRFSNFKNWRQHLGFEVRGWDRLGSSPEFPKKFVWDKAISVKINFKDSAQNEERKLMHDALFLLTVKANSCFYPLEISQSGYSGDIREEWKITDKLYAIGSGDQSVTGQIYYSIDKHFREIHKKYHCIESIEVNFSGRTFTADPPTSSGD